MDENNLKSRKETMETIKSSDIWKYLEGQVSAGKILKKYLQIDVDNNGPYIFCKIESTSSLDDFLKIKKWLDE